MRKDAEGPATTTTTRTFFLSVWGGGHTFAFSSSSSTIHERARRLTPKRLYNMLCAPFRHLKYHLSHAAGTCGHTIIRSAYIRRISLSFVILAHSISIIRYTPRALVFGAAGLFCDQKAIHQIHHTEKVVDVRVKCTEVVPTLNSIVCAFARR